MDHSTIMKERPLAPRTVDSPQEVRMFKGPRAALIPFVLAGALLLPSTALAGERAPAPVTAPKVQATGKKDTQRPQAYYKKIQHQWLLEQKALYGGNMETAKMHRRKGHTLSAQYRRRVRLAEQAAGPEVVLWDPSMIE
jgi:hypothetical protein